MDVGRVGGINGVVLVVVGMMIGLVVSCIVLGCDVVIGCCEFAWFVVLGLGFCVCVFVLY